MSRTTSIVASLLLCAFSGLHAQGTGAQGAKAPGASGAFANLPRGHWAYGAIAQAARSDLIPGFEDPNWGNHPTNRYQVAVLVSRMLQKAQDHKTHGRSISSDDVSNLESLTIEFADELALLNVKVSTLEDTVASLKRDVDSIKADMRGVGARAGIWGTASARYVSTDDGGSGYGQVFGVPLLAGGALPVQGGFERTFNSLDSSATAPIVRYTGGATGPTNPDAAGNPPGSAGNPIQYEDRNFFTMSQFSLNFDREFDPGIHFHGQVDINAEGGDELSFPNWGPGASGFAFNGGGAAGASTGVGTYADGLLGFTSLAGQNQVGQRFRRDSAGGPLAGGNGLQAFDFDSGKGHSFRDGNIQVNELYVVWDDLFSTVDGRIGAWALPLNSEVNGPSRTYQWTITPTIVNTKWESLRQTGVDIFQNDDSESMWWYGGIFTGSSLNNGVARSGTLLSGPTGDYFNLGGGAVAESGAGAVLTDGVNRGDGLAGRFANPLGRATMTDAPQGARSGTSDEDTLGYYFLVGSHPTDKDKEGLRWHGAYYDNNGEVSNNPGDFVTAADWEAYQLSADYQMDNLLVMGQYYGGESQNNSRFDFSPEGITVAGFDARHSITPFLNDNREDTQSTSWFLLANYSFLDKGSVTARYEEAKDETGLAFLEADVWTLGFNWQTSDHSWFQTEFISPETSARSETGVVNNVDIEDDLWQMNYKLTF